MNKLTTINTIKKAAPLALLAVVMSGSAFAGGPGQNNGKKQDRTDGAKLSVDVKTTCSLNADTATAPFLTVTTEITDSNSEDFGASYFKSATAQAQAKDKGIMYSPIGIVKDLAASTDFPNTFTNTFYICDAYKDQDGNVVFPGLSPDDKSVTALSTVVINDGEHDVTFTSQCENIFTDVIPYPDGDGLDDDGVDDSAFDLGVDADQYYVHCPSWD